MHTPGPWVAEGRGMNLTVVFVGKIPGNRLATCAIMDGTEEERMSNARLIAAAPDMLAALQGIAKHADDMVTDIAADIEAGRPVSDTLTKELNAWSAVGAAIAKATGETCPK